MAGAERRGERRSSSLLRLSFPLVAAAVFAAGCREGRGPPSTLLDGSPAHTPAVELEGVDLPADLTTVTATGVHALVRGSPQASCVMRQADVGRPRGAVITRVGVSGETVTFRGRSAVAGCDASRRAGGGRAQWCGGSYGRLFGRRLRDPRLDIAGCRTSEGRPVAFAWINPGRGVRYVVIRREGFAEVYPVVRGLPVRVATTSGIASDPIEVSFDVSEHDAGGRALRAYRLTASPAG